jgi:DNA-binding MarR family transcriptional regulator
MDAGARRELEILNVIAEGRPVTQRALAQRLGIALGLANLYLKRLARKGHIKVTTIPPNRLKYLVTPRGVAQKIRLTYEYMRYSLDLYRQARLALRDALTPLARGDRKRIAIYGTGEAAELAYLTLKELSMEPAAVLHSRSGGRFLGLPVRDPGEVSPDYYDHVVVATLDAPDGILAHLEQRGIPKSKLIPLRPGASSRGPGGGRVGPAA